MKIYKKAASAENLLELIKKKCKVLYFSNHTQNFEEIEGAVKACCPFYFIFSLVGGPWN